MIRGVLVAVTLLVMVCGLTEAIVCLPDFYREGNRCYQVVEGQPDELHNVSCVDKDTNPVEYGKVFHLSIDLKLYLHMADKIYNCPDDDYSCYKRRSFCTQHW